ncbi:SprT-like domain-containing protein [Halorarius halobius]|uniref:SprT-like domain-containing protein n=1 Tax=Halorarius halobius TaxID=2962671 RepID=UPI0020CE2955|nr:SprT-like domain-containing protein [Halorarius halobius]
MDWPPATDDRLREWARRYARTVDVDAALDAVSWEVSARAKRRAGACIHDPETGAVTIRLAARAAERFSREAFEAVVRHELIHAWEYQQFGEAGHGRRFRKQADRLNVETTCPTFSVPRLRLYCTAAGCDWSAERHRASAVVTDPEDRRCGACGARYEVEHVASGETWRTSAGYRGARDRIEDW